MANFHYVGRNAEGNVVKGYIEASNSKIVAEQLIQQGITPTQIQEAKEKILRKGFNINIIPERKVRMEEMLMFCRQMNTLLHAGIPILGALEKISKTTRSNLLSRTLKAVADNISEGHSLADSLRRHPKVFSSVFASIVDAGESSGQLDVSFKQLHGYLKLEDETVKRIKKATRYPTLVIVVLVVAMFVVNFMVVPAFANMFASFKAELPLPTRIVMGVSNFLTSYWPFVLGAIIILFFMGRAYLKTTSGRYLWDKSKLKMPIVGPILRRIVLARFSRSFTMMIQTGVPLNQGLALVANAVGNAYIQKHILYMRDQVERGASIVKSATETRLFTPLVLQMLAIGESSGSIDQMLEEVAVYYEGEVDYDLARLGDLIEPVLLGLLGVMVLGLMLAVFLPMWDMVNFANFKK